MICDTELLGAEGPHGAAFCFQQARIEKNEHEHAGRPAEDIGHTADR